MKLIKEIQSKFVKFFDFLNEPIAILAKDGSESMNHVLSAFTNVLLRWLVVGAGLAILLIFLFTYHDKSGWHYSYNLVLDGQTIVGLITLAVSASIAVSGALVAIVLAWRSLSISAELKRMEEAAQARDEARFMLDIRDSVQMYINSELEKVKPVQKNVSSLMISGRELHKEISNKAKVYSDNLEYQFNVNKEDIEKLCAKLEESQNFEKAGINLLISYQSLNQSGYALSLNTSLPNETGIENFNLNSKEICTAYLFSLQWLLNEGSGYKRKWEETASKRPKGKFRLYEYPSFVDTGEAGARLIEAEEIFSLALFTLSLPISKLSNAEPKNNISLSALFHTNTAEITAQIKSGTIERFGGTQVLDTAVEKTFDTYLALLHKTRTFTHKPFLLTITEVELATDTDNYVKVDDWIFEVFTYFSSRLVPAIKWEKLCFDIIKFINSIRALEASEVNLRKSEINELKILLDYLFKCFEEMIPKLSYGERTEVANNIKKIFTHLIDAKICLPDTIKKRELANGLARSLSGIVEKLHICERHDESMIIDAVLAVELKELGDKCLNGY